MLRGTCAGAEEFDELSLAAEIIFTVSGIRKRDIGHEFRHMEHASRDIEMEERHSS
ncbi:hypothetical protein [Dictyobacter kobayashii]|uniref:Uncharacterized protein n=1 Tax=Dictyobacter kobayashii TaxID=2014872 RepID=A0A402AFB5_9CHLR|nr:hypothetical protein [Dictyobacter kobayashii]GCE17764.1 hypothetical protein KDK_15640 [Dictyobacter kobayashii]